MKAKSKSKVKKTKWTPKRIFLLLCMLLSFLAGTNAIILGSPLHKLGGLLFMAWMIGAWRAMWPYEDYGYHRDGTFDWSEWKLVLFIVILSIPVAWWIYWVYSHPSIPE